MELITRNTFISHRGFSAAVTTLADANKQTKFLNLLDYLQPFYSKQIFYVCLYPLRTFIAYT